MLTPTRHRGVEILDDPAVDPDVRDRSMRDVARANRWLGGLRAALLEIHAAVRGAPESVTLLDIGTGTADIPLHAKRDARNAGMALTTIGVDNAPSLLRTARTRVDHVVCADALALPFRDHSVDVVTCSQVLHHFADADAARLIREMNRVARRAVVVSDLRRSWIAMIGFWLVSFVLGFHRVTRHDGAVSVLRGFTSGELIRLVQSATGATPSVRRRLGFRLTARWKPHKLGVA